MDATNARMKIYCKLWLTDKDTGAWEQKDLTGKSGCFWIELGHVKVENEWKLNLMIAHSED